MVVVREGKVLLGLRKGAHGAGTWALPGGKPDPGESFEQTACRELYEETGMIADPAQTELISERPTLDHFIEGFSFQTFCVRIEGTVGEPVIIEPLKCERWGWFGAHDLPSPLFLPLVNMLNELGYDPFAPRLTV